MKSLWITVKEFAEDIAGVKEATVLAWIKSGELVAYNVANKKEKGGRPRWRIPPESIEKWKVARASTPALAKPERKRRDSRDFQTFFPPSSA